MKIEIDPVSGLVKLPTEWWQIRALDLRNWSETKFEEVVAVVNEAAEAEGVGPMTAADAAYICANSAFPRLVWGVLCEAGRLDLLGLDEDGAPLGVLDEDDAPNEFEAAGSDILAALHAEQWPFAATMGLPDNTFTPQHLLSLWWAGSLRRQIESALRQAGRTDLLDGDTSGAFKPTIPLSVKWARRIVAMQFGESERSVIRRSKGLSAVEILELVPIAA